MKSPNAKTSMDLLRTAQQAIRHAWEDLKNDEEVRSTNLREVPLHSRLRAAELEIQAIEEALVSLGYKKAGKDK